MHIQDRVSQKSIARIAGYCKGGEAPAFIHYFKSLTYVLKSMTTFCGLTSVSSVA